MSAGAGVLGVTIVVDDAAAPGLVAEHGLAIWLEIAGRRLLFDTGQGAALEANAARLGLDLARVDALVLSHGHYDHTGGLDRVVALAPAVEVFLHPAATGARFSVPVDAAAAARSVGMPAAARRALERHPSERVHRVTGPLELGGGVGVTGPIARLDDFEDTGGPFFLDAGGKRPDRIEDDLALWLPSDRGLVLVVGCSHAGLVNTLRQALRSSGASRVHAVLGGFHLRAASDERLRSTVEALLELEPDLVVPCHCTGDAAVARLEQAFGDRVVRGAAGTTFTFATRGAASSSAARGGSGSTSPPRRAPSSNPDA